MKRTPVAATHLGRMEKRRRRRLVGYSLATAAAGWTARTARRNLDRLFFTCTGEDSRGEEESSASAEQWRRRRTGWKSLLAETLDRGDASQKKRSAEIERAGSWRERHT